MRIYPAPVDREDGGADYRIAACKNACYSLNEQGMSVEQCPFCEVKPGWVEAEIHCSDGC
jgi:hypothetical protein